MSVRFPLIVFVGPPGVGKTHFMKWCVDTYRREYRVAKSVTTRQPRDEEDKIFYDFLSPSAYLEAVNAQRVVNTTTVRTHQYGLDLEHIRGLIKRCTTTLIALNVDGVNKIRFRALDIAEKMLVVELVARDERTLIDNLRRRFPGDDAAVQKELLRASIEVRPVEPHARIIMAGENNHLPALHHQMRQDLGLPPI